MAISLQKIIKEFILRMGCLYCLVALLIGLSFNKENISLGRINHLKDYAFYPRDYLQKKTVFNQDQFRYARKYYRALIEGLPYYERNGWVDLPMTLGRTYVMLAICEYYLGRDASAVRYFQKALKLEPRDFWINYNLGLVYFKQGRYAECVGFFQKIMMLNTEKFDDFASMDYFQNYWPPEIAEQYQEAKEVFIRNVVIKSFELSVLAYERLNNHRVAKSLALLVLRMGIAGKSDFFVYHAGLTQDFSGLNKEYSFMYNPSLDFIPIGQEKIFVKDYVGRTMRKDRL